LAAWEAVVKLCLNQLNDQLETRSRQSTKA